MKKIGLMMVVLMMMTVAIISAQAPEVFPGSVRVDPGNSESAEYYSRGPLSDVLAYFERRVGAPTTNTTSSTNGAHSILFIYDSQPADNSGIHYSGVRVTAVYNPDSAVTRIMQELRGSRGRGYITQARYQELEQRFAPLAGLFFLPGDSGQAVDEQLYRQYLGFLRTGSWMGQEELQLTMQRMARKGDSEGMRRLSRELEAGILQMQAISTSAALADHWIECLEKIEDAAAENGFPVRIDMRERGQRMPSGYKG